ncbi:MAG: PD-(D/E)XK nuclease family protein [Holosporaceae bacterium]
MMGFFQLPFGCPPLSLLAHRMAAQNLSNDALSRAEIWLPTERARRSLIHQLQKLNLPAVPDIRLIQPILNPLNDTAIDSPTTDEPKPQAPPPLIAQLATANWLMNRSLERDFEMGGGAGHERSWTAALCIAKQLLQLHHQLLGHDIDWHQVLEADPSAWSEQAMIGQQLLQDWQDWWPGWLGQHGYSAAKAAQQDELTALQAAWQRTSPPIIWMLGADGALPLDQQLMRLVAMQPQGAVLLPAMPDYSAAERAQLAASSRHPHGQLMAFLHSLGGINWPLRRWPAVDAADAIPPQLADKLPPPGRQQLVQQWFAPPNRGGNEVHAASLSTDSITENFSVQPCQNQHQEAQLIALAMRRALDNSRENPDYKAALITPDRQLAKQVAAALKRWNIVVDDSAGQPLIQTPLGRLVALSLTVMQPQVEASAVLALLYHPLCSLGMPPATLRAIARTLDAAWRGLPITPSYAGLIARWKIEGVLDDEIWGNESDSNDESDNAAAKTAQNAAQIDQLLTMMQDWQQEKPRDHAMLADWLEWHRRWLDHCLTRQPCDIGDNAPQPNSPDPNSSEAAQHSHHAIAEQQLNQIWQQLTEASPHLGLLSLQEYHHLLTEQLAMTAVRQPVGQHPRLAIWGVLEGRLQQPDLLILGGLNEGVWPSPPPSNPWLPNVIRHAIGLPDEAGGAGTAAYDFIQNLQAPNLLLTFSHSRDGQPAAPCRWLIKLRAMLTKRSWQDSAATSSNSIGQTLPDWETLLPPYLPLQQLEALDSPSPSLVAAAAPLSAVPAPNPDPALRPRQLSASQLQQLMTDPYSFYAATMLRLQPRPSFDDGAEVPRNLGNLLHHNLELFSLRHGTDWPQDAPQQLLNQLRDTLGLLAENPMMAYHWQRLTDAVNWLDRQERQHRNQTIPLVKVLVEKTAKATMTLNGHSIQLRARADRIDVDSTGGVTLLDYKTGSFPRPDRIQRGLALQLTLEAWLLDQGGFGKELANTHLVDCQIWRLNGGEQGGADLSYAAAKIKDLQGLIADFSEGAANLLSHLLLSPAPFYPDPWPDLPPRNDYAHLKRRAGWL